MMTDDIILPLKVVDIRKCRKCYQWLRISVAGMLLPLVLQVLLSFTGLSQSSMQMADSLIWMVIVFFALLYLVFIAALAAENYKNPVWYFLLAMLLKPVGIIISFILIRRLGQKNGWVGVKKRRFQRAKK